MAAVTHFIHDSIVAPGSPPTLGTAFDVADVHAHDLQAKLPEFMSARNFRGIVAGIHIRLTSIATATKLTMRLCADPEGDYTLVPDTEATIAPGITTTTSGCVAFSVELPLFQILGGPGNGTLYLFAKLDGGSANFAQSCITWKE